MQIVTPKKWIWSNSQNTFRAFDAGLLLSADQISEAEVDSNVVGSTISGSTISDIFSDPFLEAVEGI